jgi:iron complex outermembrane recepter protein
MNMTTRAGWVSALLALSALTYAAAAEPIAVRIDAQPVGDALKALAQQTGIQLLVDAAEIPPGAMAPKVDGRYGLEEALKRILSGTQLKYEFVNKHTVAVRLASESTSNATRAGYSDDSSLVRVAQTDTTNNENPNGQSPSEPTQSNPQQTSSTDSGKEEGVQLEEIVVTGTHIRGTHQTAVPSLSITREDIERGGYPSIENVFRDLPQNFGEITPSGAFNPGASRLGSSNVDRTASIDLRGLGAQSTLILLNGTRRAPSNHGLYVDVSTIPVSVIDRVDVVTAGRSAIYGADAVAGVVNLITRRRFEGVETQLFYNWADDGGESFQGSLTTGGHFDRGGIVVAYDFARDWSLDLVPMGLHNQPLPSGADLLRRDYLPDTDRHTGFLAGEFALTDAIQLFLDAIFTSKDTDIVELQQHPGAAQISTRNDRISSDVYNVSVSSRIGLAHSWTLAASAGLSESETDNNGVQFDDFGPFTFLLASQEGDETRLSSFSLIADGPLPAIGSVVPRAALGMEYREEKLDRATDIALDGFPFVSSTFDLTRDVQSIFGEALIPLVESGRPGLLGLQLSLAGRYDDYSDFGSSFTPQVGVVWEIVNGLQLRGAYSEAFRAPALNERRERDNGASIQEINDPAIGGPSPVLFFGGDSNNGLTAEKADVWSMSVDYQPHFAPSTRISASYFNIAYEDRLDFALASNADFELALANESLYPGLIDRTPTDAEIDEIVAQLGSGVIFNLTPTLWDPSTQTVLEAFPGVVIFDSRLNNIAVDRVSGVDLGIDSKVETPLGTLSFGLNATRTLEHERKITVTSPAFDLLNEVGKPVDLRARLNVGLTRGAYGLFGAINYTDSYLNPLTAPSTHVASWTTTDLTFRVDGSALSRPGFFEGFRVTVGIINAFDREPPNVLTPGYLFDAANVNPLGRQVSLRVVKSW